MRQIRKPHAFGLQAPPLANTPANGSKQGPRTKPKGSRILLCALGSRFWGESPDGNVISRLSSGYLGRKPGREKFFLHLIRISGEISRTSVAPPYTLERLWAKSGRGVSKNNQKHRFWIPLGNKTGKMRSRCFRAGTNQNASRCANPVGGSQNVLRYAIPISISQGRRAFRSRSPALA